MKIAIIGAGIAGRLSALMLARSGHKVQLVDASAKAEQSNCSFVAAGMLSPYAELEKGDLSLVKLGLESLSLWPALIDSLVEPVFFQQRGSLLVAHGQDSSELVRFAGLMRSKLGASAEDSLHFGKASDWIESLPHFDKAIHFPEEGQLDATAVMRALGVTLQAEGVAWLDNTRIESVAPGHFTTAAGQRISCDWVFDCRGLGAADDIKQLRSVRGEIIHLQSADLELSMPVRLLHPRYAIYIVPRPEQQFLVGATEIESDDDSAISVRSALELLSAAFTVHPALAEARIVGTATHCRPACWDNQPLVSTEPGLTRVNGLYRHGFLLAPALVNQALSELNQHCEATDAKANKTEVMT